ncbi:protease [Levilactobacillus koreensis JCM 16448]|uniref:Protease n=1 Tax=Levilactobacillus koreensis TaxID=637971 RepID=A0AAC9ERD3_9LACO|nr:S53 family peptidase [Levilactobacillus koreensis]AKP64767.1 protease [Levilactobacillus koreensis]KRK87708.1 protease [Levilactobacillus koreensis JCM 16448]
MKIRVLMASLLMGLGSFGVVADAAKTTPLATPYRASQLTSLKKIKKLAGGKTVTLDLVLKPRHSSQLTQTALAVNTPGSSSFKDFLTPQQFRQRFGQSTSTTQRLTKYFKKRDLTVTTFNDGLFMELKGSASAVDKTFATNLETARYHGTRLQYSAKQPRLPKTVAQPIEAVVGMTNLVRMTSLAANGTSTDGPTKTGAPQNFLTQYHATAVADQNQGKGQTIGIISFSKVDTRDITHFWSAEGIPASANRLSVATTGGANIWGNVDPGNTETSLDVEQAGALAPQAKIRVYTAALSDVGWINAFASAFGENRASSLSLSWGISEGILQEMNSSHLLTPLYGNIMNVLLAQGATQGISTFAATGDSGAYSEDLTRDGSVGYGIYTNFPADNPWVTATGGTTLPISGRLPNGARVDVTQERTWGGDVLFAAYRQDRSFFTQSSDLLSMLQSGSGGGISALYATPKYQQGVSGVNTYAARQYLTGNGLPRLHPGLIQGTANGRNYPDVVADADPLTGYDVYTGTDGWETMGGTSFVAPQFAALAADINSDRSQRVGLWNPQLYSLAQSADSPFTRLDSSTANSNLYYVGQPGKTYNQAAGLGTVDFDKLAQEFK